MAIPNMLSLLTYGRLNAPVKALNEFPVQDRPPVFLPFIAYHLMIQLGMFMIGLTFFAVFLLWRGKLYQKRWLLWLFVFAVAAPFLSNQAGWVAAEVGRQPWVVYGLLRTDAAYSKAVSESQLIFSLTLFGILYLLLFGLWIYILDHKIRQGPEA